MAGVLLSKILWSSYLLILMVFVVTSHQQEITNKVLLGALAKIQINMKQLETNQEMIMKTLNDIKVNVTSIESDTSLLPDLIRERTVKISCITPWVYVDGAEECLLFTIEAGTWDDAREKCQMEEGGDLAILDTTAKQMGVGKHIGSIGAHNKKWWVGGTDRTGLWQWVDGTNISTIYYPGVTYLWHWSDLDEDSGNNTCTTLYKPVHNKGKLFDDPCDDEYPAFICQK